MLFNFRQSFFAQVCFGTNSNKVRFLEKHTNRETFFFFIYNLLILKLTLVGPCSTKMIFTLTSEREEREPCFS